MGGVEAGEEGGEAAGGCQVGQVPQPRVVGCQARRSPGCTASCTPRLLASRSSRAIVANIGPAIKNILSGKIKYR